MKFFGEFGFEQKCGVSFGVVAFILSFITGLVSGVGVVVTIIRSLIMFPAFFIVGYGTVLVLKNFVPEIYEAFVSAENKTEEAGRESQTEVDISDIESDGSTDTYEPLEAARAEEFTELTPKNFDRYSTKEDSGLDASLNTSGGKLGKHIIIQEQFNSYEPKIMAQAIRTMMSKDKD